MNGKLLILTLFFISGFARGQGLSITIVDPASDTTICRGDTVNLKAITPFLITDFDNGTNGVGWSSTQANPVYTNPCGVGPKNIYLWVGTTASNNRTLVTNTYDLTQGGACFVEFWMRYGLVQGAGSCEDPDSPAEGVHLQYTTNGGSTWLDFPGPNIEPVGNLSTVPPFTTQIAGSGGYWAPYNDTLVQSGSTLYFWNKYRCPIPSAAITTSTAFRWAQLATSSAGFDAWGIDEVLIGCEPANIVWNTGNTTTTDTVAPVVSTTYWVKATDGNGNSAYDTVDVNVVSPTFNLPYDTLVSCNEDSVMLDAGGGWNSYEWSNGSKAQHSYVYTGGDYHVVVKDANGCWASDTVFVEWIDNRLSVQKNACAEYISPSGKYRWKVSGIYKDTVTTPSGCDSMYTIDLTVYPVYSDSVLIEGCYGKQYTLAGGGTATQSGVYLDTLYTVVGCDSLIYNKVQLYYADRVTISIWSDECAGSLVVGAVVDGNGAFSYLWSDGNRDDRLVDPKPGYYWVEVTNQNGCVSFDSSFVGPYEGLIVLKAFPDTIYIGDGPIRIGANSSRYVEDWLWEIEKKTFDRSSFFYDFRDTGYFPVNLNLTTHDSCSLDTVLGIYVKPRYSVFYADAFTPDGDGMNDTFGPVFYKDADKDYTLQIYSRWGKLMFEGENEDWNGMIDGKEASTGVYMYCVTINDAYNYIVKDRGYVTLIR